MRIALLVEYLHARGGTQRQALALAQQLGTMGHQVTIFTALLGRHRCFPDLTQGLEIRALAEMVDGSKRAVWVEQLPQGLRKSLGYLARSTGATSLLQYNVLRQSTKSLSGLVLNQKAAHRFDVINPHDFGAAAWAALEIRAAGAVPVVWQCNDPLLRWAEGSNWLARSAIRWLIAEDRRRVQNVDAITVLDTRVAEYVNRRYGKAPTVVRSGVDADRFLRLPPKEVARARLGLPDECPVALVLTLLTSPHRRVEDAIAAHARGPDKLWLLLAAPASDSALAGYPAVVARAIEASSARNRIRWLRTHLESDDRLRDLFAAADFLVFPNVLQTWGLAVIEASAAGLPVIVSDQAGVHEVFDTGETGLCFRGGDIEQLSLIMKRLADDAALRRRVGEQGQTMVRDRFSWRKYAQAMESVFAQSINANAAGRPGVH